MHSIGLQVEMVDELATNAKAGEIRTHVGFQQRLTRTTLHNQCIDHLLRLDGIRRDLHDAIAGGRAGAGWAPAACRGFQFWLLLEIGTYGCHFTCLCQG